MAAENILDVFRPGILTDAHLHFAKFAPEGVMVYMLDVKDSEACLNCLFLGERKV